MSNIFNILIQARVEEFDQLIPVGAGKSDIKPGQIVIDTLFTIPIGINGEATICYANWKPTDGTVFYEGQLFKMHADVLYNSESKGAKAIPATELVDKLIWVGDPRMSYQSINYKVVSKYNVKWMIVDRQPKFITPENAWMHVLFANNAKTLGEASDNITNSAADSLLAAYGLESQFGSDMVDEMNYTEDSLYDNLGDCYDAKIYSDTDFSEANMNEDTHDSWDDNSQNGSADCPDAII